MDTNKLNNNIDPNQLIATDEIIRLSKESGVKFGFGDSKNRIRYLVKNGLLPHQVRKVIDSKIVPQLPYSSLARLIEIQSLQNKFKYTVPQLIAHFNDSSVKTERAKYELGDPEATASPEIVDQTSESTVVPAADTGSDDHANPVPIGIPTAKQERGIADVIPNSEASKYDILDANLSTGAGDSEEVVQYKAQKHVRRYVLIATGVLLLLLGVIFPSLVSGKGLNLDWLFGPLNDKLGFVRDWIKDEDNSSGESSNLSQNVTSQDITVVSGQSGSDGAVNNSVSVFGINLPVFFSNTATFEEAVIFESGINLDNQDIELGVGSIFASNVIYTITGGDGMQVSAGQNPVLTNTGVLSVGGQSGDVELDPGDGIEIDGTEISNTGVLSLGGETGDVELTAGADIDIDGLEIALQPVIDTVTQINLPSNSSTALRFGGIGLGAAGTSAITSGAYLIGVYDEFTNSNSTNLQDVLDDLDSSIAVASHVAASVAAGLDYLSIDGPTQVITLGQIDLATDVTGFLTTASGGLGASVTAVGAGEILYSTGATTYDSLPAGNLNQILISGGVGSPDWDNITTLISGGDDIDVTGIESAVISLEDDINLSTIRASTVDGIGIYDDGLNLGVYVIDGGDVGIGRTAPAFRLDVNGTGRFSGNLTLDSIPNIADNNRVLTYNSGVVSYIDSSAWDKSTADDFAGISGIDNRIARFDATGNNVEDSSINDLYASGVALTIDINGRLGIGTTAPGSMLSVGGGTVIGSDYATLSSPLNGLLVQGKLGIGVTATNFKLDVGGTANVTNLSIANTLLTSTALELNILSGATLSTSELNILSGATLSTSELNYLDGTTVPAGAVMFGNGTYIANDQPNFYFDDSTDRLGIGTSAPGQTLSVAGTIGIIEGGTAPQYYTVFRGQDQSGPITYTLPPDDGSNDYVLATDGAGVLTWKSATGVGAGSGDITAVIAGSGLTGGAIDGDATLDIGAGNGITVTADDISIKIATTGVGSTASFSGLQVDSDGLRMLSGCGNAEILGWDDTNNLWECTSIASVGGVTGTGTDNYIPRWNGADDIQSSIIYQTDGGNVGIGTTAPGSLLSIAAGQTIGSVYATYLAPTDGLLVQGNVGIGITATNYELDVGGTANLSNLSIAGALVTSSAAELSYLDGTTVVTGGLTFGNGTYITQDAANLFWDDSTNRLGIGTTAPQYALDINGGIGIAFGSDLYIGNIGLGFTSPSSSGALLVGVYDEFANSDSITVQGVLNDLDAAITGFSHTPVTLTGLYNYLTIGGVGGQEITLGQIDLATDVAGFLATANGGLGADVSATTAGEILYSTGATTYDSLIAGVTGQLLISAGTAAPGWSNITSLVSEGDDIDVTGTTAAVISLEDAIDVTSVSASTSDGISMFDNGGNLGIFVEDGGNVGIGTTNPIHKLDVSGNIRAMGNSIFGDASGDTVTSNAGAWTFVNATTIDLANSSTTALNIEAGLLNLDTQNGSVGIGTTSPSSLLHLSSSVASTPVQLTISAFPTGNGYEIGGVHFRNSYSNLANQEVASVQALQGAGGGNYSDLIFSTANNSVPTEKVRITKKGYLGIGTTAPESPLTLAGGATIGSGFTGIGISAPLNGLLVQGNTGIGSTNPASLFNVGGNNQFQINSTGNIVKLNGVTTSFPSSQGGAGSILTNDGAGTLTWGASSGTGTLGYWQRNGTDLAPANIGDSLGIGTTSPTASLQIVSDDTQGNLTALNISQSLTTQLDARTFEVLNNSNYGSLDGDYPTVIGGYFNLSPTASFTGADSQFYTFGTRSIADMTNITFDADASSMQLYSTGASSSSSGDLTFDGKGSIFSAGVEGSTTFTPTLTNVFAGSSIDAIGGDFTSNVTSGGNANLTATSYGIRALSRGNLTTTGTTEHYGGHFTASGTADTNYGVYLTSSGATTNYGLYSASGTNYFAGSIGIGTTSPVSMLSVGGSSQFQVNSTGNIVKLNNVTTSFPSSQGDAGTVLTNDGAGNLTWDPAPASSNWQRNGTDLSPLNIGDSVGIGTTATSYKLDILSTTTTGGFQLTADAVTSGIGANFSFDGLTTGTGLNLASTSNVLSTGSLVNMEWIPSSTVEIFSTGDLFKMNVGEYGNVGNIFALYNNGADVFKVSQTQIESAVPHAFTAAGDVSIANDLVFTNQTSSNIQSYGPLTISSGESSENLNLTLKTYGTGDIVFDAPGGVTLNQAQEWTLATSVQALSINTGLLNIDTTNSYVGIGTTTPVMRFDVASSATKSNPGLNSVFTFHSNDSLELALYGGFVGDATATNRAGWIQVVEDAVAFRKLYLNPYGGFVGIGTSAATQALSVNGRISMATWTSDGDTLAYRDTATNSIALVASDRRLKKNIVPLTGALDIVKQLGTYKYNDLDEKDGSKLRLGVMGQEVLPLIPELTYNFWKEGSDETYYGVHYDKLPVLLLEAMKEQQVMIDGNTGAFSSVSSALNSNTTDIALLTARIDNLDPLSGKLSLLSNESLTFDSNKGSDTYQEYNSAKGLLQVFIDGFENFRFGTSRNSADVEIATSLSGLAENYPTMDETLEPGDVVVLDNSVQEASSSAGTSKYMVAKSGGVSKDKVLGVVSSKPGLVTGGGQFRPEFCKLVGTDEAEALQQSIDKEIRILAEATVDAEIAAELENNNDISAQREDLITQEIEDLTVQYENNEPVLGLGVVASIEDSISACKSTKQVEVAVAGKTPVKYDVSSGQILSGDLLAVSEVEPGKVIKATGAGWVVGRALQDSTPEDSGMIMMAVNLTWYSGDAEVLAFDTSSPTNIEALKAGLEEILEIQNPAVAGGKKRAVFFSDMNVMGEMTANSFSTLGEISAGFLTIDGTDDSISVLGGGDLKLQNGINPGNIDAFNGTLVLTSDGGIIAKAQITAETVAAKNFTVLGAQDATQDASVGEGIITTGTTQVVITNANVKAGSKVFVTATTDTNDNTLVVSNKIDGSFTVTIKRASFADIKFDYWVIGVQEASQ